MFNNLAVVIGTLIAVALLAAGCGGGGGNDAAPRTGVTPSASATPTGLTEADPLSPLGVKGRDRFRACVEVLDHSISVEDAKAIIEEALLSAAREPGWNIQFKTPSTDVGCPLPPVALASNPEAECRSPVSPYLAYVFVADEGLFAESFPAERLRNSFPVPGIRRGVQEKLSEVRRPCADQVAEGWYITPDELQDSELLQEYIFGIYPIASVCC